MSEVEKKNVEGSVVKCESSVGVIKRDFGNQYLEWKEVYNNKRLNRLINTYKKSHFVYSNCFPIS